MTNTLVKPQVALDRRARRDLATSNANTPKPRPAPAPPPEQSPPPLCT